ncbi:MAG: hypothetical protein ABTQ32_26555 [Myxococcaceae bacterium]
MALTVYVEGTTDVQVAIRVAQHAGFVLAPENVIPVGGYSAIDANLRAYYQMASAKAPVWVLRDCDPTMPNFKGQRFARCAGKVVKSLGVPNSAEGWAFRLARHEAEAWLLADSVAFADWLGVEEHRIAKAPDEILKAKLEIVRLARTSTKTALAKNLVPREGSSAEFGPAFEDTLQTFVTGPWNPTRASKRSVSLRKCIAALRALKARRTRR